MFNAPIVRLSRATFGHALKLRRFSSRNAPSFATVPTSPAPTCPCAETPALPDGLEIDHKNPLNGVMTAYHEHVLVCTGTESWPSRIEEDNSGDNLAADLKELMGRGGVYSDVSHGFCVELVYTPANCCDSPSTTSRSSTLPFRPRQSSAGPSCKTRLPICFRASNTFHFCLVSRSTVSKPWSGGTCSRTSYTLYTKAYHQYTSTG